VTRPIIEPPPWNGGIASSSSGLAHSTPMPFGPVGLVAGEDVEIDAEGAQVDRTVRRALGAVQHTLAPTAFAASTTLRTSSSAPVTFETCAREISLVLGGEHLRQRFEIDLAVRVSGSMSSSTPLRCRRSCQGTMLEWCSSSEIRMRSPRFRSWP
jgi:hypothetical protein